MIIINFNNNSHYNQSHTDVSNYNIIMESKAFEVYCCNGHPIEKVCTLKSCPNPAAICR